MSDRPNSLTGDIRTHAEFSSEHVSTRTVLVYLPPKYEASDRRYPVLYLHDGQNVFNDATAYGGVEWRVDETAQQLISAGLIEPLIVVAIYNSGETRPDDYTQTATENGGGHSDAYGRMLVDELKPFIDTTYRTLADTTNTAMGGASLGGLVTLHVGLRHPKTFGKLAAMSPSVWWDDRVILREIEGMPRKTPQRLWVDAGTREGADVIPDARRLRDVLVRKGWSIATDLMYYEARGGEHNERSWARRVGPMLKFLFPPNETR